MVAYSKHNERFASYWHTQEFLQGLLLSAFFSWIENLLQKIESILVISRLFYHEIRLFCGDEKLTFLLFLYAKLIVYIYR